MDYSVLIPLIIFLATILLSNLNDLNRVVFRYNDKYFRYNELVIKANEKGAMKDKVIVRTVNDNRINNVIIIVVVFYSVALFLCSLDEAIMLMSLLIAGGIFISYLEFVKINDKISEVEKEIYKLMENFNVY